MSTLIIRKNSLKTWLHTDSVLGQFIISKFYFSADDGNFQIVEQGQSKRVIYDISDITLYDDTGAGTPETFGTITALSLRLEELNYPAFQYDGQIVSIANLIEAGTNVTITGSGTLADPYIINSSGGGGTPPTLQEVVIEGEEIVTDDGLYKMVLDRALQKVAFYGRNDVLDPFVLMSELTQGGFQLNVTDFFGTDMIVNISPFSGIEITNSAVTEGIVLNNTQAQKNGIDFAFVAIPKTSSFTAQNDQPYTTNGTLTITDPTPEANKGYIVHVIGGTSTIGGVGYTAGALVYRYYNGSVWISTDFGNFLKRDGSNANSDVDLQAVGQGITGSFVKGAQIEINTNGDSKKGVIKNTDLLSVTNYELPENGGVGGTLAVESYVDTETSAVLALLNAHKARTIFQPATSVTGVSTQTQLFTMKIDANVYASTDAFMFNMAIQKGTTAGSVEYRVWVGASSGALTTQIARYTAIAATRTIDFIRPFYINSGNLDTTAVFNSSSSTGIVAASSPNTPVAVTMSSDIWITVTVTPTNNADVSGVGYASITPLK